MKLLYAGSFDPFTTGHEELVSRALALGAEVVIAVGVNSSKAGSALFPVERRVEAIKEYYVHNPNVSVTSYTGATVDFARQIGAQALLRGVRSVADFEQEALMARVNKSIEGLETLLLVAQPSLQDISSSLVRELASCGRSVKSMVIKTFNME